MPVQSINSTASAQTQQSAAASKKVKKEFIPSSLKNDIVSIKDMKTSHKVAIGVLTLSSAIAGLHSAKSGLFKTINTIIMAAVGLAASISLTKAADKDTKNKPEKTADDKKEPAPAPENSKQEVKQDAKAEDKPEVKPEKEESEEKGDDKDDD